MTDDRRARPPLATVICIYEVATVLLGIVSYCFLTYSQRIHPSVTDYTTPLLQSVVMWLRYVFALTAAIALWQMRRSAFYLLAGRAAIALVLFLVSLLPSTPPFPTHHAYPISKTIVDGVIRIFTAAFLILHVCIAWYSYNITSPEALPPQGPGSNPLP